MVKFRSVTMTAQGGVCEPEHRHLWFATHPRSEQNIMAFHAYAWAATFMYAGSILSTRFIRRTWHGKLNRVCTTSNTI